MHLPTLSLLTVLAPVCALAGSGSGKAPLLPDAPPAAASGPSSFAESATFTEWLWGKGNALDAAYDNLQQWKKDNSIPISIGAHHWWHVDRSGYLYGDGYGIPGERGTYYYWLNFDPAYKLSGDGFLDEFGLHIQGRIRDSSDKLRGFYNSTAWTYEAYGYAKTDVGTFKAGQIVQDFSIAWDNSWYEGVSYFDEYRFNPSWGLSWNNTWKLSDSFSLDTTAQYFIQSDHVSGGLVNSSAATTEGLEERNTGILRLVPTWKLNEDTKLAWGSAVLARGIHDGGSDQDVDDSQVAWETDLTLTYKNFSVWGQYIDSYGVITPARYVSGGPSDRQNSISTGINYKIGPVAAHVNYSRGWDHNPGGHQDIFLPGLTFQLSKSLTLYADYVKWDVTNSAGSTSKYEDGFNFALVWNL